MADDMLRRIYQSTLEFLRPIGLEERYQVAVEEAVKVMDADYGTIFLADETGELMRVYSNVPYERRAMPRKHGYTHKAFVNNRLYIVSDDMLKKVHKKDLFDKGVKSLILIPLSFSNKTIGVLSLQLHTQKELSRLNRSTVNLFGSLISLGIRNSQLYEQIKDAVHARDLFISLASHELKTPLTTIAAYGDFISKKVKSKQLPSEKSVEVLGSEIKRLKHMLNELLELDQIKTGQLRYSVSLLNIKTIIKKAVINFKFTYPGYKVLIEDNLPRHEAYMEGDAEKLQQVFTNILNNSAKFSSRLTPIVISLSKEDNFIFISISDYGKGIRKREQNNIFKEFFKADGNMKEGMGLGLYLVKGIIERHKGTISLYSKLHKGTTIQLKLPHKLYE